MKARARWLALLPAKRHFCFTPSLRAFAVAFVSCLPYIIPAYFFCCRLQISVAGAFANAALGMAAAFVSTSGPSTAERLIRKKWSAEVTSAVRSIGPFLLARRVRLSGRFSPLASRARRASVGGLYEFVFLVPPVLRCPPHAWGDVQTHRTYLAAVGVAPTVT